jgi:hypothetical protein
MVATLAAARLAACASGAAPLASSSPSPSQQQRTPSIALATPTTLSTLGHRFEAGLLTSEAIALA